MCQGAGVGARPSLRPAPLCCSLGPAPSPSPGRRSLLSGRALPSRARAPRPAARRPRPPLPPPPPGAAPRSSLRSARRGWAARRGGGPTARGGGSGCARVRAGALVVVGPEWVWARRDSVCVCVYELGSALYFPVFPGTLSLSASQGAKTVPCYIGHLMLRHPKVSCVPNTGLWSRTNGEDAKPPKNNTSPPQNSQTKTPQCLLLSHGVVEVWVSKFPWPLPA